MLPWLQFHGWLLIYGAEESFLITKYQIPKPIIVTTIKPFTVYTTTTLPSPENYKHFYRTNRNGNKTIVKPVYSEHLWFLKKVSAITRRPLYRGFKVIFTGSKFHEFRVLWTILLTLVPTKTTAKVLMGLFENWSTFDPKTFYAIPFQKLMFLVSLYPDILGKKTKK